MRVIKITAVWCGTCLVMNKIWNKVLQEKNIETTSLDYDMDEEEVEKYNPGKKLPVFIFEKDNQEVKRIIGDHSYEEMLEIVGELEDE